MSCGSEHTVISITVKDSTNGEREMRKENEGMITIPVHGIQIHHCQNVLNVH